MAMKKVGERALHLKEAKGKLAEKEATLRMMVEALVVEEKTRVEAESPACSAEGRYQEAIRALDCTREVLVNEARNSRVKMVEDFLQSKSFRYMRMGFTLDDRGADFSTTLEQLKKAERLTSDYNFDADLEIDVDENEDPLSDEDIPMVELKAEKF